MTTPSIPRRGKADVGAGSAAGSTPRHDEALVAQTTRHREWLGGVAILLAVAAAFRLLHLTWTHAVNVLYWDHWGYYSRVWDPAVSLWGLFTLQHGPHFGGAGYALYRLVLPWTRADMRIDGLALVSIVALSSLLALMIRRRLSGTVRWYDLGLVLLFVPPGLALAAVDVPNPAHGAMPLLFVLLCILAWTDRSQPFRYGALVPLNFLALFTGFGLFWGFITPLLIGYDLWHAARNRDRRGTVWSSVALLLVIGALCLFFSYYKWRTGDVVEQTAASPARHATMVCLVFARMIGAIGTGYIPIAIGAALAAISLISAAYSAVRAVRQADRELLVPAVLLAFSIAFAVVMATGRIYLTAEAAQSPRYIPLMLPAALGLYLCVLRLPQTRAYALAVTLFLLAGVWTGFHLDHHEAATMAHLADGKRRWVAAYLQTRDPDAADRIAGFAVSPNKRRLPDRLVALEQRQLSFFAPGRAPSGGSTTRAVPDVTK